jgi:hypothetical protein
MCIEIEVFPPGIIPSHIVLVGAEIEMINYPNRKAVLKILYNPKLGPNMNSSYRLLAFAGPVSTVTMRFHCLRLGDCTRADRIHSLCEGLGKIIEHY